MKSYEFLNAKAKIFKLTLREVDEKQIGKNNELVRTIRFELQFDKRPVMRDGLEQLIVFNNQSGGCAFEGDMIRMGQGDSFTFINGPTILATRIFRTETRLFPMADEKNALFMEIVNSK